ncbi:MAG: metal ABC transporter substrate-binding protein [Mycobacteriales bacterium]
MSRRRSVGCFAAAVALALAGCGGGRAAGREGDRVLVAAAFYPLEFVAMKVGGNRVRVSPLTKPGAEPHDIEPSTDDLTAIFDADVVLYLRGFQPAIDDALGDSKAQALDVGTVTWVDMMADNDNRDDDAEHDPHFWLDPLSLAKVGDGVAERFAAADKSGASAYGVNAGLLRAELTALDGEIRSGLANCASRTVVTTHAAFAYLARAYGLTQVGISGVDPEAEPKAADIARVSDVVRREKVTTVFFEPLVSRAVAETVARESGAKVALLDPIEGIDDESQGSDYLAVMRANLAALRSALDCT